MAERDADRPAPGALSTEEADRLSERFRPSWEPEGDPPTVPRAPPAAPRPEPAPPRAAPDRPAPVPVRPIVAPKSAPIPVAPVVAVAATKPQSAPTVAPLAEPDPTVTAAQRFPTLVGIQPAESEAGAGRAHDDLDWELPAGEAPEHAPASDLKDTLRLPPGVVTTQPPIEPIPIETVEPEPLEEVPVAIDVEELPPPSKPSGIGEKYVPKELGAPAVVLKEDVQATEAAARAQLDAQHRSRRAPTIARMKAIELPTPTPAQAAMPAVEEVNPFAPKRTGLGWLLLALLLFAGAGAAGVVLWMKRAEPASQGAREPSAGRPRPAEPTPLAVPPPTQTTAAAAPEEPAPATSASPPGAEASDPAARTAPEEPALKRPPTPKPAPKPVAATPKPAAPKPASGTSKPPGGSKGVIVRDTPF